MSRHFRGKIQDSPEPAIACLRCFACAAMDWAEGDMRDGPKCRTAKRMREPAMRRTASLGRIVKPADWPSASVR
ncbi:hypothetical protein RTBOTA2_004051 [Rhodotorula toruloides]|nr:hypothetical protein RTBOTA2_004051 [Rhodotorula toruloides]